MIIAATALKNGRMRVTPEDAIEGSWAWVKLFDVDLRSLPLVVREGRSGYEEQEPAGREA